MSEDERQMINGAKLFIKELLESRLPNGFHYHNLQYTYDVLEHAETIGKYEGLSDKEFTLLRLGALFHDVGYVDCYEGHEEAGTKYVTEFMKRNGFHMQEIDRVNMAIRATKVPQSPIDSVSRILCDADLFYLSDPDDYFQQAEKLRKEWQARGVRSLGVDEFHENSLEFFNFHRYHTLYGKSVLMDGKAKVAEMIRDKLSKSPKGSD